ncbi:hypothetical protein [Anaerohalosphaera lusitana]|uniref:hypothetical protein n=1 Tax=Anaerohalosphaera lusitana TaxID=1936003 RepID=UPI0011BA6FA7|nr:hypothetical protein [Anaerohalosphaera lusitana]
MEKVDDVADTGKFVKCLKRTKANDVKGWKVGEPINNLTRKGDVPSWSAVRQRYWKNEAFYNESLYSRTNIERMRRGLAPQRPNNLTGKLESMELHHAPPKRDGGLFDFIQLWPDEHGQIDEFRHLGQPIKP